LPSRSTSGWQEFLAQGSLSQARIAAYERLMEAEQLIAQARAARGASDAAIDGALAVSEVGVESLADEELVLTVLSRLVAELGGRLEVGAGGERVTAVFADAPVRLPPEPGGRRAS
jgi:hypothetical protein